MNKVKRVVNLLLIFIFTIMQVLCIPVFATEDQKSSLSSQFQLKQSINSSNYTVGDTFDINYDIGSLMGIDKNDYDAVNSKDKEIVLVLDTSGSMKRRDINRMYRLVPLDYGMDYYYRRYPIFEKSMYNKKTGAYDYYVMLENGERYIVYDLRYTSQQYIKINDEIYYKYIKINNQRYYLKQIDSGICAILFEEPRIEEVQKAAKKFVEKFKGKSNVKMSVVSYGSTGRVVSSLTNELDHITSSIDNDLRVGGATNVGDGIRIANGLLKNGNNADKYMVLMTDGIPTAATCYNNLKSKNFPYYYPNGKILDGDGGELDEFNLIKDYNYKFEYNSIHFDEKVIVNYGDNDYGDIALNYSKEALKRANESGVNNFVVGFSNGISRDKLTQIADEGKGYYREAMHGDELEDVYKRIADEINNPVIKDIEFKLNLPDGLAVEDIIDINSKESVKDKLNVSISKDGRSIKFKLDNISYNEEKDENGNIKYVVSKDQLEKFKFSIKVKANKSGEYVLGDKNNYGAITYTDVNGATEEKRFETEKFSVKDGKEALNVEKMGVVLGKDNFKILEKDIKLMNGFRYEIGTIINIGDGQKAEEFIQNDSVLKSSISGVKTLGKTNFKLYSIEDNKLHLITGLENSHSNEINIPKNTLKKNGQYILVEDCIINNAQNKEYDIENEIELENSNKNKVTTKGKMVAKLVSNLPNLD